MSVKEATRAESFRVNGTWRLGIKRSLDVLGATCAFVFGFPLIVVLGVLVRLGSPGPILYRQVRVGKGGQLFSIIKFRTMYHGSDELLAELFQQEPETRMAFEQFQKMWRDPRLTRNGRWLRRSSLDELPQLWNVIKGEMSLVGPRPFLPDQLKGYGQAYTTYIHVRPGMTGLWQVSGRNHLSFRERVRLDQEYLTNWSLLGDISILIKTVVVVLSKKGAY